MDEGDAGPIELRIAVMPHISSSTSDSSQMSARKYRPSAIERLDARIFFYAGNNGFLKWIHIKIDYLDDRFLELRLGNEGGCSHQMQMKAETMCDYWE